MKFYRDENNHPCADAEGDLSLLAAYLEKDVQGDREAAVELLQFLERKHGERTAHSFSARFDDQGVHLRALEGSGEEQTISRNIFFQAVEAWIVFIGS